MRNRITVVTAGIAAALLTVAASRPGTPPTVHHGVGAKHAIHQRAGDRTERRALRRRSAGRDDLRARSVEARQRDARHEGRRQHRSADRRDARHRRRASITISDLKVDPKSHNSFVAVMRGQGPNAQAGADARRRRRQDRRRVARQRVVLERRAAERARRQSERRRSSRSQSITNLQYLERPRVRRRSVERGVRVEALGRSAIRSRTADRGTSVEIFHGTHGQLETRSPVYTFLPTTVNGEPDLIAAYLCTPLVRFPVSSLSRRPEGPRHDDRGARRGQPSDRHDQLLEGRQ